MLHASLAPAQRGWRRACARTSKKLKESPLIAPDVKIYGFVYDVTVRSLACLNRL